MDKGTGTFAEAILPMMVVSHRALLSITTAPAGEAGGYHELPKLRDDEGNPVWKYYEMRSVCRKCWDLGVRDKCRHFGNRRPAHQSEDRVKKIGIIQKAIGRSRAFELETSGVATTADDKCFSRKDVEQAFGTPYTPREHHEYPLVVIAVDPNGGRTMKHDRATSDFAIVTTYYNLQEETVVYGTTAWPCEHEDEFPAHLVAHHRRIRANPALRNATICLVPECKLGFTDNKIVKTFRRLNDPRLVVIDEAELKTGIPTNHRIKTEMAIELRDDLKHGFIRYDANMFSTTPGHENDPAHDREKLRAQLLAYREITKPSKDAFSPSVTVYNGKPGLDDLAVALQLGCKYGRLFKVSPKYRRYRNL